MQKSTRQIKNQKVAPSSEEKRGAFAQLLFRPRFATFVATTLLALALGTTAHAQLSPIQRPVVCNNAKQGQFPRRAYRGDRACVSTTERDRIKKENQLARSRSVDGTITGACLEGFVWRELSSQDRVCVPPTRRSKPKTILPTGFCKDYPPGYVLRSAFFEDYACVPKEEREKIQTENDLATERTVDGTRNGSCKDGYVKRNLLSIDRVCVPPERRSEVDREKLQQTGLPFRYIKADKKENPRRRRRDRLSSPVNTQEQFNGHTDLTPLHLRLKTNENTEENVSYTGLGLLSNRVVRQSSEKQTYRRAAVSYTDSPGLSIFAETVSPDTSDRLTTSPDDNVLSFTHSVEHLHIINQPSMGNHAQPGGLQAHGDYVAIAMGEPQSSYPAGVYFVRVNGLTPEYAGTLYLGFGGAPYDDFDIKSASAAGFVDLEQGYLVAISGAKQGRDGIWFYRTYSNRINRNTDWSFIDFWRPERLPDGICDPQIGQFDNKCFIGANKSLSLFSNEKGEIYMLVTTDIDDQDENSYAQLYHVDITGNHRKMSVNLTGVRSDSNVPGLRTAGEDSKVGSGGLHIDSSGNAFLLTSDSGKS